MHAHGEAAAGVAEGVVFWGRFQEDRLVGVMGLQDVDQVTLIRHAYVRPQNQRQGIGAALLSHLRRRSSSPLLVGTWRASTWAVEFYEKHGFRLVAEEEKDRLLRRCWSVPERQIEESVVLVEERWFEGGNEPHR